MGMGVGVWVYVMTFSVDIFSNHDRMSFPKIGGYDPKKPLDTPLMHLSMPKGNSIISLNFNYNGYLKFCRIVLVRFHPEFKKVRLVTHSVLSVHPTHT